MLSRWSSLNRLSHDWPWQSLLSAVCVSSLVVACTLPEESPAPQPDSPVMDMPTSTPASPALPEAVRDRVLAAAAADLQQPVEALTLQRHSQAVWMDGCLGLGQPNELCLQALTEGWQVEVGHDGQSLVYRTDATGEVIRQAPNWLASQPHG